MSVKFDLTQIEEIIMFQFAGRNMKVFKEPGIKERKKGSGENHNSR